MLGKLSMDAQLVMFRADGTRREFPLHKERLVLGRTNDCDLRIPLSSVSRQHCELRIEQEQILVRDLGSSNGTFHNNLRVQEAELDAGDEISIGPVVFILVVDGKPEKMRPVPTIVDAEESSVDDELSDQPYAEAEQAGAVSAEHGQSEAGPDEPTEQEEPQADIEGGDDAITALESLTDADEQDQFPMLEIEDEEPKREKEDR